MRPHIICHMLCSVDGKIDGGALRAVANEGDYETAGTKLNGEAWVCGRTTMEQHFASGFPRFLRIESPRISIRWALWTSRSRIPSASVGSPICSCQRETGSCEVTMVERTL